MNATHDTTTPRGLGFEHGVMAAEMRDVAGEPDAPLSDAEVLDYFVPTDDDAAVVAEYRDGWRIGYHAAQVEAGHAGMYGECCAPPLPATMAEHREQEAGWRYHWGWIDGARYGGPSPAHAAPDYRRGWDAATSRHDHAPEVTR